MIVKLGEIIDQQVRRRRDKSIFVPQAVGHAASHHSRSFSGRDTGIAVTNDYRARGGHLKTPQRNVQKRRMGFFLRCAVAAKDRIEAIFHAQAANHGERQAIHLVAHHDPALGAEVIEHVADARIEHRVIEQMPFVMTEKYPHDLLKIIGTFFLRQGLLEQMFHAAADVDINRWRGQRRKIEMSTGKIDGLGEIVPRICKSSVEVKHDQINRSFHSIPIEIEKDVEVNARTKNSLPSVE